MKKPLLPPTIVDHLKKINLFKLSITMGIIVLLIMLNTISKNGRYQNVNGHFQVIDTRTGNVYELEYHEDHYEPYIPSTCR